MQKVNIHIKAIASIDEHVSRALGTASSRTISEVEKY